MTKTMRSLLAAAALAALPATVSGQQYNVQIAPGAVAVPRGDLFIHNADAVWTANDTVYHYVSLLIRGGVIRSIGANLTPPSGVQVIDGAGFTLIPGFVDEHSHIAMRATNEGTAPVVPEVRVVDALDPGDMSIYQALSGGVTTAQILHGSANPIGGQSAIIKTRWGMDDARQLLVQGAPQTVKFALGENVTQKNFGGFGDGPRRFPASREGVEAVYVEAFTAAQAYKKTWDDYRKNPKDYRVPPRRDLRLETLVDIMEGRIRVHAHSYRADEIMMLMRVAERFGFKIDVFTHVLEGYKVADEMAAHGAAGSTFTDWWMYKLEAYDAIPYNAAVMFRHGVLTSINSDIPWLQSSFIHEIQKPVKYGGVSREDALRMLTRYPAQQLLIADKVGTIEVGKQADLVMLSGDPFDSYTRVERTIVDGIVYYDRQRDAELRHHPVRPLPSAAPLVPDAAPTELTDASDMPPGLPGVQVASLALPPLGGAQAAITALVGATVHPVSAAPIADGVVVIENGRIQQVGPASQVSVPAGAQVINVAGKHVYPGLINPITQLGMVEMGQVAASRDDQEIGRYNPHIRALTGIHPSSAAIPVARANGLTTVLSAPATGVIQGMGTVIQLSGDTPERMVVKDTAALLINFPSPPGTAWDDPKLEGERLQELVDLFNRAMLFAKQPTTDADPTAPFEPNTPRRDRLLLQALVPVVTGQVPAFFLTSRERDIRTLFLFLDKFPDIQGVVVGGDQAFRVADELARRKIPVILTNTIQPTSDPNDPVTAQWQNAGILYHAGVTVAFGTNDVETVRNVPYHAAWAVAYGLPKDEGLKGVTLNAARILGVADRLGSIEPGKRADLIVTTGDPLQIITQTERMWIAGQEVSLDSKQTELYAKFKNRSGR